MHLFRVMATESVSGERPLVSLQGFLQQLLIYVQYLLYFLLSISQKEKGFLYTVKSLILYPARTLCRARKITLVLKLDCLLSLYLLD